jgi:predicted GH43/DUF377 family glycosyl hydrolase
MKSKTILTVCTVILSIFCFSALSHEKGQKTMFISDSLLHSWSEPYRQWNYYPGYVVDAGLEKNLTFEMVDGPNVYRHNDQWHMLYFGYDGNGYQSCLAISNDLINWRSAGRVMGYGAMNEFDYGGVVLVGPLYDNNSVCTPPQLKRWQNHFWILYGCYPKQGGYELGQGGQGLAWSEDGLAWNRYSKTDPILSIKGGASWENKVIYSPCLIEHDGQFWNFYNAKGKNGKEQIGFATSGDLIHWKRYSNNPVIKNSADGYDALLAADAEIYWDTDHWVMFYFGASRNNPDGQVHAHTMAAFSRNLIHWRKHPEPIFKAGRHPQGLDRIHAHNISLVYNPENDTHYMFYCAVGDQGRGIGLLTSKTVE